MRGLRGLEFGNLCKYSFLEIILEKKRTDRKSDARTSNYQEVEHLEVFIISGKLVRKLV